MRYSSAMVLSTFAVGQAAASHMHNRHASFHERRQAEAKRSAGADVNWDAVAYDLKDVDWDKVQYGSPAVSSAAAVPTVAAAAVATPAPTSKVEKAATTSAQAYEAAPSYAAAPSYEAASSSKAVASSKPIASSTVVASSKVASSSAAAQTSHAADLGDFIGDIIDDVSDILHGVSKIVKDLGIISVGRNDKHNNGGIWVGEDSQWKAEFTNDATEDAVIFCWKADGFSGMSLNVNQPEISVGLKSGESVVVSFAPNVPAACAPAFGSSSLANFGGLDQTWWEATFGNSGCFDVSRNVNMNGRNISSKGSKCVSDMNTCVFKCKDDKASSCEKGTDYDLFNCEASNGGGGGYDTIMAGTGGGCSMGSSGEHVQVSFS